MKLLLLVLMMGNTPMPTNELFEPAPHNNLFSPSAPTNIKAYLAEPAWLTENNRLRATVGLSAQQESPVLSQHAQQHTNWMANRNSLRHSRSSRGRSGGLFRRRKAGSPGSGASPPASYSENIAVGSDVWGMWRRSSGHWRNIQSAYRYVGFGQNGRWATTMYSNYHPDAVASGGPDQATYTPMFATPTQSQKDPILQATPTQSKPELTATPTQSRTKGEKRERKRRLRGMFSCRQ